MRVREEVQKVSRQSLTERLGKRERVLRTLSGEEVDRRPFTFWHSFGLTHMKGESLVAAALSFAALHGVDLLRLPVVRDLPLPDQTSLDRPHDLTQIPEFTAFSGFWNERLAALESISQHAEKKIAVFESIPEPYTALGYVCRDDLLGQTQKSHPSFLEKALETISASLEKYVRELAKQKSVDGICVEIESATFEQREPGEFESLIKPHLEKLLQAAAEVEIPVWLHVRGTRVYLKPLFDLPHQMITWPQLSSGPKLDKALPKGYKKAVAGGLDEKALLQMSYQDIRRHVDEARDQKFDLLCAGDYLSADMSPSKLNALSTFLKKRDRDPEQQQESTIPGY